MGVGGYHLSSYLSIVPQQTVQVSIMHRMVVDSFSLHYSDDNKKNTFENGGNNGHRLSNFTCKQT